MLKTQMNRVLAKDSVDEYTRAIYDARRTAIKWTLVTCFGYMGYLSSRGLAKLRLEMTFHFVYMQMTKPSHIGLLSQFPFQRAEFGNPGKVAFVKRQQRYSQSRR